MSDEIIFDLNEFFSGEYLDFSVYDNVRKIASFVDGQKNASRKILHTVLQKNISNFTKVSNLGPEVQSYSQYLHGSLESTIVNMTADYVGSGNNMPILLGDGNFGSAFIPAASATRYIFAKMNPVMKSIFNKDDYENLDHQQFEGDDIEPRFYVPVVPMIAINGAEGVSIGFAQKILPRRASEIIKWVKERASNMPTTADLTPYWSGMTSVVSRGETPDKWIISGSFERKTKFKITITSLPIGYDLKQYHAVLDKLQEDKEIRYWTDHSDDDVFKFEVAVDSKFAAMDDEWIMNKLKLVKRVAENYTCVNTQNKIQTFSSFEDVLEAWFAVRMEYNEHRKVSLLGKYCDNLLIADARSSFIQGILDGAIVLKGKTVPEILSDIEAYDKDILEYADQLLNMPLKSMTVEEKQRLDDMVLSISDKIDKLKQMTDIDVLMSDLNHL